MPLIYFAHSYRDRDAAIVDYFGKLIRAAGLTPSLDPPSDTVNEAKLQRHLNTTDGVVAVLSRRKDGTSPHILFEISLAIKKRLPLLVFVEDTLPNKIISSHVLQQRFSFRSFFRETREYQHALGILKGYLGERSLPPYKPTSIKRSCLVLNLDLLDRRLQDEVVPWITDEAEYDVLSIPEMPRFPPWKLSENIGSVHLVISLVASRQPRSYFDGLVAGAGVPCIEITGDPNYIYDSDLPREYQPDQFDPADGAAGAVQALRRNIDLYEQDFLELGDPEAIDRYTDFLVVRAGSYDANTRLSATEVIVGDKYEVSGQAGAVGRRAHARDMKFQQLWLREGSSIDLALLAQELDHLRQQLRTESTTREQDFEIAQIGAAAEAAENGDGPGAFKHLAKVGRWAFNVATAIGAGVAAGAIKTALGL